MSQTADQTSLSIPIPPFSSLLQVGPLNPIGYMGSSSAVSSAAGPGLQALRVFFTGRISPKGSSAGIDFTHGPIFEFFTPQWATRCTDQGEIWKIGRKTIRSSLSNFTLIGSGVWVYVYGPQNLKKLEF